MLIRRWVDSRDQDERTLVVPVRGNRKRGELIVVELTADLCRIRLHRSRVGADAYGVAGRSNLYLHINAADRSLQYLNIRHGRFVKAAHLNRNLIDAWSERAQAIGPRRIRRSISYAVGRCAPRGYFCVRNAGVCGIRDDPTQRSGEGLRSAQKRNESKKQAATPHEDAPHCLCNTMHYGPSK